MSSVTTALLELFLFNIFLQKDLFRLPAICLNLNLELPRLRFEICSPDQLATPTIWPTINFIEKKLNFLSVEKFQRF